MLITTALRLENASGSAEGSWQLTLIVAADHPRHQLLANAAIAASRGAGLPDQVRLAASMDLVVGEGRCFAPPFLYFVRVDSLIGPNDAAATIACYAARPGYVCKCARVCTARGCTVHSRAKDLPKQRRALTDMADVAIEAVLRRSGTPPTSVAPNEWLRARSVSLAGGSSTPLAPCRNNPGWREFTRSWLLGWCGKSFSTAARLEGNCRMASPAGECAAFSPARLR